MPCPTTWSIRMGAEIYRRSAKSTRARYGQSMQCRWQLRRPVESDCRHGRTRHGLRRDGSSRSPAPAGSSASCARGPPPVESAHVHFHPSRRHPSALPPAWLRWPSRWLRQHSNGSTPRAEVVVVGGHPDDPESGCGGTMARFADAGNDVVALYLTRGEEGSRASRRARRRPSAPTNGEWPARILKARPDVRRTDRRGHGAELRPLQPFETSSGQEKPDVVSPTGRSTRIGTIAPLRC